MEYQLLARIPDVPDGTPVSLRHLLRNPTDCPLFPSISWRTTLPNGKNRQWYWLKASGYWTLPLDEAKQRMEAAARANFFATLHDDPFLRFGGGHPRHLVSSDCTPTIYAQLLAELLAPVSEPDWGPQPFFVVSEEPGGTWRKVMLIDTRRTFASFRSLTTDDKAGYRKDLGNGSGWWLHNTMMDCSPQTMREFLNQLRRL